MSLETVLQQLRHNRRFNRNVVAWQTVPARPARYAEAPAGLSDGLVALLRTSGTWPLYLHQSRAVEAVLRGENVVVVTGTASGKTLCYNLPVLQTISADPGASALYLFPTKALAQDQYNLLAGMISQLGAPTPVNLYDGDTPNKQRASIRRAGGIVLSNPEMLHMSLLPHHTRWARFFSSLKLIVLDEIHAYRGVFGSHLANVLRRLRRICQLYGSQPRFVCTSATIANPAEHARRLVEAPVTLIPESTDGSPQGERHLLLYNPPMINPALGLRRSATDSSADIANAFLRSDLQTILFSRTRLTAELLLVALREGLSPDFLPADALQGYRGGYLASERRAIERGLREGTVRGVVATSALELGVDIGELTACVLAGYPGSVASTQQQAGRVGRRLESSAAVLVASANPLDQYLINHPEYLFERSPERALTNPDNLVILVNHLLCAAFELPFEAGEGFGEASDVDAILGFLAEAGRLHREEGRTYWIGEDFPAATISLRSGSNETIVIQDIEQPSRPLVIGHLERESAPLLLYEGAIYPHRGNIFLVETLDWEGLRADVRPVSVEYYTRASLSSSLEVLQVKASAPAGAAWKHHGRVLVTSQATGYRKIKRSTHETLGWGEIDLPPQQLDTAAYWLALTPELTTELEAAGALPAPINYGPNWEEQRQLALTRDDGRCRHCGAPERPTRRHDVHHLQPFRSYSHLPSLADRYRQANALDNLITLCSACHRRAESQVRMRSALAGLASLMHNLAPLFLMCDPHDISVLAEGRAAESKTPTVTVYERVPAGVGFSQQLFQVHSDLLMAAQELVAACPCHDGCPACVGPAGEVGPETKKATLHLLSRLADVG